MRIKMRQKINTGKGFSLTELLAAVLILAMVSSVVAGGIPVAKDAYEKVTLSANAQVMLSTAISALRNELCIADDVVQINDTTIEYYDSSIRNYSKISIQNNDIMVTKYSRSTGAVAHRLIPAGANGEDQLHVKYESVTYSESSKDITFMGLKVINSKNNKVCAKMKGGDDAVLVIHLIAVSDRKTW